MKTAARLSTLALALSACSQGALPSLPSEQSVPTPTLLEVAELDGALSAGDWTNLSVRVLDQFDEPMAGQVVTAQVQVPEGERPGLVPGLGNTCRTGVAGERCAIALRSEGPVGRYTVALSTGALPAVERSVEVVANRARARLELGRDGAEAFFVAHGIQFFSA